MDKLLLTPLEVAEVTGLGRTTVYQFISQGTIPAVKIGRAVRVPVADLKAWIDSKKANGTQ